MPASHHRAQCAALDQRRSSGRVDGLVRLKRKGALDGGRECLLPETVSGAAGGQLWSLRVARFR